MGGGASKPSAADKGHSQAIKQSRDKANELEKELTKVEEEKGQLQTTIQERLSDIEKLGELNRSLERANQKLKEDVEKAGKDTSNADEMLAKLRVEMDQLKKKSSAFEAELREIKGELIVEKEEHNGAREEIDRVGQLLTEAIQAKEEVEKKVAGVEEERSLMEQMLKAATESADTYKELSSKLMDKKKEAQAVAKKADSKPEGPGEDPDKPPQPEAAVAKKAPSKTLLDAVVPKVSARFKVCIISTFEDFFMERETLLSETVDLLSEWCEAQGVTFEVVDLWSGLMHDQYKKFEQGLYIPTAYFDEIEDSDLNIILMGQRYGADLPEEAMAQEAQIRPWLAKHRAHAKKFGSVLELCANYAAFVLGVDSSLPPSLTAGRSIVYIRDPAYVEGLPDSITRHFKPEGTRAAAKLDALKDKLRGAGLVKEESYADPANLAQLLTEDVTAILSKTFKQSLNALRLSMASHESYQEAHMWTGQGAKGVPLPEAVEKTLERIRKYVVNAVPQPLVLVGEAGSGRTSLLRTAVFQLRKRFPAPDTLILPHYATCNRNSHDPIGWIYKVCKWLQDELQLQMTIPTKPADLLTEFPLWLESAAATGVKIFLFLDGVDICSKAASVTDDPVGFLPKSFPQGIRCIVSTGSGPALTSLAQRGCGAITLWPIDEKQKETLINGYLNRTKKQFDKRGVTKLLKSERTGNPQFLLDTMVEINEIGVLDGTASMEPLLYYLEADNLQILTEKVLYRWESAYAGKIIGGSLVRDVLTCVWASRFGLRRPEIAKLLGLGMMQLSPLLRKCSHFLLNGSGMFNLTSTSLADAIQRRYMPNDDAVLASHKFLANFFEDPHNGPIHRRVDELIWQIAQSNDAERLCKTLTKADYFEVLFEENRRQDLWNYVAFLERNDAHLNLGTHCKSSALAFELMDPRPPSDEIAELNHKYGAWLAEIGFVEVSTKFLVKALDTFAEGLDEDDERTAATCETLAKVMANMRSENAEKFFERAVQIRTRLGRDSGPSIEFATLCNEYGLYQKRAGKYNEAIRLFMRALEIWARFNGVEHLTVANASLNLCTACYAVGSISQAREHAKSALDIRKFAVGDGHPLYAEALVNLAAVELASGEKGRTKKEAERQLWEGIAIFERTRGGQHSDTLWARSFVAEEENADLDDDDDEEDEANVIQPAPSSGSGT